jgi:hypothetical protein
MNTFTETYHNIKVDDKVIFKEGRIIEKYWVKEILYKDNLKIFKLIDINGKLLEVSVDKFNPAHCPWHFIDEIDWAWRKK